MRGSVATAATDCWGVSNSAVALDGDMVSSRCMRGIWGILTSAYNLFQRRSNRCKEKPPPKEKVEARVRRRITSLVGPVIVGVSD